MTDKRQSDALHLAGIADDGAWTFVIGVRKELAAELRRQYAEIETLRTGYEAARLEIESLNAQLHAAKQSNAAQFWLFTSSIPGSALRASHWQAPAKESLRTDALCDLSYSHGLKAGWNYCASDDLAGFERAQKIGTEALSTLKSTTAQAAPAYKDSTPELHIGDSAFESWYSTYSPAHKSDKQRARDAYAAGMGDPLVTAAPAGVDEPAGRTDAQMQKALMAYLQCTASELENYSLKLMDGYTADVQRILAAITPAHVAAQEPNFWTVCAQYEGGDETGWIPLPGYSNETEHGVKNLVLQAARKEGYKGTVTGRLMELNWEIRPVYLAPWVAPQPSPSVQGCALDVVLDAFENKTRGIPQAHIAAALVAELRAAIEAASTTHTAQGDAQESEYRRGYRHGYEQSDAEVRGALV